MLSKSIWLLLSLFPMLATSVALIGTGLWVRRKHDEPPYDVGGMVAIVLGALIATWAVFTVILAVAFA